MKRLVTGAVLLVMLALTAEAQSPGRWVKLAPFPEPSEELYGAAAGGKFYVIGGRVGAAFIGVASNTDVVEEYDPATDSWGAVRARMPTPRSASAWGTYAGRIYVAGGEFQTAQFLAAYRALEAYDPAANQWISLPPMPVPRHGLASAVVGNRLHLASGDVQSAGIAGMHLDSESHDAFELIDK